MRSSRGVRALQLCIMPCLAYIAHSERDLQAPRRYCSIEDDTDGSWSRLAGLSNLQTEEALEEAAGYWQPPEFYHLCYKDTVKTSFIEVQCTLGSTYGRLQSRHRLSHCRTSFGEL